MLEETGGGAELFWVVVIVVVGLSLCSRATILFSGVCVLELLGAAGKRDDDDHDAREFLICTINW